MTPNGNKGAMPVSTTSKFNPGFTKREYIAIEMLKSLIPEDITMNEMVDEAIQLADKLLDALER
jgi:hypothetical protein